MSDESERSVDEEVARGELETILGEAVKEQNNRITDFSIGDIDLGGSY